MHSVVVRPLDRPTLRETFDLDEDLVAPVSTPIGHRAYPPSRCRDINDVVEVTLPVASRFSVENEAVLVFKVLQHRAAQPAPRMLARRFHPAVISFTATGIVASARMAS